MAIFVDDPLTMLNALMIFKENKWQIDTIGDDFESPRGNFARLDDALNALVENGTTGELGSPFDGLLNVLISSEGSTPELELDDNWVATINDGLGTFFNPDDGQADLVGTYGAFDSDPLSLVIEFTNASEENTVSVTGVTEDSDTSDAYAIDGDQTQDIAPGETGTLNFTIDKAEGTFVGVFTVTLQIGETEFTKELDLSSELSEGGGGFP